MKFFKAKVEFRLFNPSSKAGIVTREYGTHSETIEGAYAKIYEQMEKEFDITKLTVNTPYETEGDMRIVNTRRYVK